MLVKTKIIKAYPIAIKFDEQKRELQLVGSNLNQAHEASLDPSHDIMIVFAPHAYDLNPLNLFTIRFGYFCAVRLMPLRRATVVEFERMAVINIDRTSGALEYDEWGALKPLQEFERDALNEIISGLF